MLDTPIGFNERVQGRFVNDVTNKLPVVERKASEAIESFARLVDELIKLKQLSTGTPAKEQITKLTSELNNSSVFFTKMISDEINKLHEIVSPDKSQEAA
ncbi:MAG: hypothetical protein HYY52_08895 [Candidatus Melainabacteria bacterium]|nr:hypothetical protein [Candidatus Melainabacteria bacterium]